MVNKSDGNKKAVVFDVLDDTHLSLALKEKAQTIICNIVKVASVPDGIEIVNANARREHGSWLAYSENKKYLNNIRKRFPDLFMVHDYDLFNTLAKLCYWANFKLGYLKSTAQLLEDTYDLKVPDIYPVSKVKVYANIVKQAVKGLVRVKHKNITYDLKGKEYLFVLNDDFELSIWRKLLAEFGDNVAIFLPLGYSLSDESIRFLSGEGYNIIFEETIKEAGFPLNWYIGLSEQELYLLNVLSKEYGKIITQLKVFEAICENQLKAIILNAAENLYLGQLITEIAEKKKIAVFNTMNGIKAATANNADVAFTGWFVWDDQMKHLLTKKCYIPENQLIACGHLMEDFASEHNEYQNSLNIDCNDIRGKLIISVFSVRDLRKDKVEGLKTLYEWAKTREDVVILYRRHNFEKEEMFLFPEYSHDKKFIFIKYNDQSSKQTLYDQLLISDLSIVFGSTVALESKWFRTPCITFETSEKSILYCVDNDSIKHASSASELKNLLNSLDKKKETESKPMTKSVAKEYAEYIRRSDIR